MDWRKSESLEHASLLHSPSESGVGFEVDVVVVVVVVVVVIVVVVVAAAVVMFGIEHESPLYRFPNGSRTG